ncbi:hypothetical protein RJ641_027731, partial [Dillenia turbinata]
SDKPLCFLPWGGV